MGVGVIRCHPFLLPGVPGGLGLNLRRMIVWVSPSVGGVLRVYGSLRRR